MNDPTQEELGILFEMGRVSARENAPVLSLLDREFKVVKDGFRVIVWADKWRAVCAINGTSFENRCFELRHFDGDFESFKKDMMLLKLSQEINVGEADQ